MTPFFDVHCHLFNILDIPFLETVMGAMKMHTLIGLATILKGEELVEEQKYFVRFFERSSETNLCWLSEQIRNAIDDDADLKDQLGASAQIVLTPLVMDFDTNIVNLDQMPYDESAENQFKRLQQAIAACQQDLSGNSGQKIPLRVYPFMGFALNKLNNGDPLNQLERFQGWWTKHGMTSADRKQSWESMPQRALGIKLYPSLGFKPYPQSQQDWHKYLEFYQWCVENDVPITVHCQPASFNTDSPGGDHPYSNPESWATILKTAGLAKLRINFAHFGGGGNLKSLFRDGHIHTDNATYKIIEMLRDYPNTFADLAAIDFSDKEISQAFAMLLSQDQHGLLNHGGDPFLCHKLIWGSDVPMVINSKQYLRSAGSSGPVMGYTHCLHYFKRSIGKVKSIVAGQPDQLSQVKQKEIMRQIISSNPELFLRSGA